MSRSSYRGAYVAALAWAGLMAAGPAWAGDVHWSYHGEEGPANWGSLSEEFSACSAGAMQSPINISSTASGGGGDLVMEYGATVLDLVNNGHTVQVNVEAGNKATLAGRPYDLLQFHFHSPSEHTVGGKSYDMEAHFVHRNSEGKLAVVGVLIEAGAENGALATITHDMPVAKGKAKIAGVSVNGADLLPSSLKFTTYSGSLTTPPCSEGVTWFVLKNSITASAGQIAAMQAAMPDNARPTQPLNGRMLLGSN